MRAPLLVLLWWLLAFEALGGLVIFFMRLATGTTPGELLHIAVGALFTLVYVAYQIPHFARVAPWRNRMDYALGLIAALSMLATLGTGIALTLQWWPVRVVASSPDAIAYTPAVSAAHNIMSMLVLAFVGAHLAAVLMRDARSPVKDRARR